MLTTLLQLSAPKIGSLSMRLHWMFDVRSHVIGDVVYACRWGNALARTQFQKYTKRGYNVEVLLILLCSDCNI
jgi:hypothetical protein